MPKTLVVRRRSKERLREIAIHEAGHVVAAHWFDLPIESVTTRWTKYGDGHVACTTMVNEVIRRLRAGEAREIVIGEYMRFHLAGKAAEFRLNGKDDWDGAAVDATSALSLAEKLFTSDRELTAFCHLQQVETVKLLWRDDFWNAVTAVADELLVRRRLDARATRAIILRKLKR